MDTESKAKQIQWMVRELKRRRRRAVWNRRCVVGAWAMAGVALVMGGETTDGVMCLAMAATVGWVVWQYRRGT